MINGIPVEAIVAIDQDNGYAKDGQIPWHFKEDFKWFQQQTKGCVGLMGAKTYKYINEKLGDKAKESVLPGRTIFVLSHSLPDNVGNATVVRNIHQFFDGALELKPNKIMFMGLYDIALPHCDIVHITRIHDRYSCDSFFPFDYVEKNFTLQNVQKFEQFDIQTWSRKDQLI